MKVIINFKCIDIQPQDNEDSYDELLMYYNLDQHKWRNFDKDKNIILDLLLERSFFIRFNKNKFSRFLNKIKLRKFKNKDIIFVVDKVYVILSGDIIIKSHATQIWPAKIIANYQEGDILRCKYTLLHFYVFNVYQNLKLWI